MKISVQTPYKLLIMAIVSIILTACVAGSVSQQARVKQISTSDSPEKKISLRSQIKNYEKQAKATIIPSERQYYLLLAAETLMDHNRSDIAKKYMSVMKPARMEDNHRWRLSALEAEIAAENRQYPIALQKLPKQTLDFPPKVQARILKVRAEALNELGYPVDSVETRIQLSSRLHSQKQIDNNNSAIWFILNTLPESELMQLLGRQKNTGVKAWVQLVIGVRKASSQAGREAFLDKWYAHYPAHPAADSFIDQLRSSNALTPEHPKNIALLLPLSSHSKALASVAEAIRDGFLAGHYSHESINKPNIKIYDVGNEPDEILEHYKQAKLEGANIIVGPLNKKAVTILTESSKIDIPVLALNYTLSPSIKAKQVFQFGLLPEDEARQVAELAIINDQMRAIVIAPKTSMGKRLQTAFSEQYIELGGKILTTEFYASNAKDYSSSIQRGFNLLQSKTRHSLLSSTLGRNIKFEPRRRQDVDVVFMIANPAQARLIKPMLAYHDASDIPVYTTSIAFNGVNNPRQDVDLNDLFFVDQPWILKSSDNEHYAAIKQYWPQKMQLNARHYSLGIDAYRIIPFLNKLKMNPFERFSGYTGSISIDSNNRMHRELIWAKFEKGIPKVLEFIALEDQSEYSDDNKKFY